MAFDMSTVRKKIQYITVDSDFVTGSNNNFSVNFGTTFSTTFAQGSIDAIINTYSSNIFIQELKNVVGLKLVDFYVTQIASHHDAIDTSSVKAVKYIDILSPDLPEQAQILDERKSKIFARVPLERDFSGSASNLVVNDKQWKSFNRQTNYFNPISIKQLNFQLWEMTGTNSLSVRGRYQPLQPDAQFYMILEVTTVDYDAITLPAEDKTVKVVEAIQSLEKKFDMFLDIKHTTPETRTIVLPPAEPKVSTEPVPIERKDSMQMYILIAILILLALSLLKS
jgi:hypothetical protein